MEEYGIREANSIGGGNDPLCFGEFYICTDHVDVFGRSDLLLLVVTCIS